MVHSWSKRGPNGHREARETRRQALDQRMRDEQMLKAGTLAFCGGIPLLDGNQEIHHGYEYLI